MLRQWKAPATILVVALSGLLIMPAIAQSVTQSYDCHARISSTQTVPTPQPGETDTWQCATPDYAKVSLGLHWFRNSLEYCRAATSAYKNAVRAAHQAAAKYGPKGWIVIMDADETVLDNSLYTREREACGSEFSPTTWAKWIKAQDARDIPGAAGFTQTVHALGGLVAIVTNRDAADDAITQRNLKAVGIWFDYEIGQSAGTPSDKVARWNAAVAALTKSTHRSPKPFIWVGDQVTDLPILDSKGKIVRAMSQNDEGKGIGERFFIIPNPVYGGWAGNPQN
ncbi:MAG: HAD family acid phosphatase [Rhizomicrobium sp.]|jgi:5'-nucleotidase (lipoprotein e(P4) family)